MAVPRRQPPPPPPNVPDAALRDWLGRLNRWFLDLNAIIATGGGVDPATIPGYDALVLQVSINTAGIAANVISIAANTANIATNTANIATNTAGIATNTANIATNTAGIATNTANIATNAAAITALQARSQVRNGTGAPGAGLGSDGDLYINNTGGVGTHLYAKITGAWVAVA